MEYRVIIHNAIGSYELYRVIANTKEEALAKLREDEKILATFPGRIEIKPVGEK